MKKINLKSILVLVMVSVLAVSCKQKKAGEEVITVKITEGKLPEEENFLRLFHINDDGKFIFDTLFPNDKGVYGISKDVVLEGKSKEVKIFFPNKNLLKATSNGGWIPSASSFVIIALKDNEEINIDVKIKDRYLDYDVKEGSKMNKDMAVLNKTLYPMISNSIDALLKAYSFEVNSIDFKKNMEKSQLNYQRKY